MKTWCKHILCYEEMVNGTRRYHWYGRQVGVVPKSWKQCPICGTRRPNKYTKIRQMRSEYGVYQ